MIISYLPIKPLFHTHINKAPPCVASEVRWDQGRSGWYDCRLNHSSELYFTCWMSMIFISDLSLWCPVVYIYIFCSVCSYTSLTFTNMIDFTSLCYPLAFIAQHFIVPFAPLPFATTVVCFSCSCGSLYWCLFSWNSLSCRIFMTLNKMCVECFLD